MIRILLSFLLMIFIISCNPDNNGSTGEAAQKFEINDPHSYSNLSSARITHLTLDINLNFNTRVVTGKAIYDIEHSDSVIVFDTYDLNIQQVLIHSGDESEVTETTLGPKDPLLGSPLTVKIKPETEKVTIHYYTSPDSKALQWLEPGQTYAENLPFLFTQGQAILTRSWIPIQDSPGIRISYDARVTVTEPMMVVMSAENPRETELDGEYFFKMEQPIPPYLMALGAGDLRYEKVSEHTGVYAEPGIVMDAAWEFAEMEEMMDVAKELYGPYKWDTYDVLVLPPSFPFGGMENPRLTFSTPTILAGDRSLVALIAHELAHSWSGNLVTNATWDDFWLNEGFTVYIERRIMEELYGKSYADMLTLLGYQDLLEDVEALGEDSPDTHLKLNLEGRDPDEGLTDVAYEKGYFFLRMIEEEVGRERFDEFLRNWFDAYAFKSVTTEMFVQYLNENLIEPEGIELNVDEWVYGPGIPDNIPKIESDRFVNVELAVEKVIETPEAPVDSSGWTPHEWLHFVRNIPDDLSEAQMRTLDGRFGFTESGNSEIKAAWYVKAVQTGYEEEIDQAISDFLIEVGRRKFLTPIYRAYKENDKISKAREIYEQARPNYHSVSRNTLDALLKV